MKGLILAAGRGSRLGSITDETPKCLLEVKNKSLINYQIEALKRANCLDIAIVSGFMREKLANLGLDEFHNKNWAQTNMVSSLLIADPWLSIGETIVSYSDIFYFGDAIKTLAKADTDIAVLYDLNWLTLWKRRFENPLDDAESFQVDDNQNLVDIGQKTDKLADIQGQYMGLIKFSATGWSCFKTVSAVLAEDKGEQIYMTDVLQQIVQKGALSIQAVPFNGQWGEVDTPDDLALYNEGKF